MDSTLLRMDNVGIVVESIERAVTFFNELGLILDGRAVIEGDWAGKVTGLGNQTVEIAMMVTPDRKSKIELSRFINPAVVETHMYAPVNSIGYLRVMFEVSSMDETVARLLSIGAKIVGEIVQYEDTYRLSYIRSADGILVALSERLNK